MKNNRKKSSGWLLKITTIMAFCFLEFAFENTVFAQCQPYIKIDGNEVLANQTVAAGLALPYWLKANQTLAIGQMVNSISVIEFTINATSGDLDFSQVLSVTTLQTVPSGKVWKIESLSKQPALSSVNGASYPSAGTYTLIVPSCTDYICVEVWGGGGGGGGGDNSGGYGGGGAGGGGYAQGCFQVTPGGSYTVIVGSGGGYGAVNTAGSTGGTSSVGSLISVTGGTGGGGGTNSSNGTGGAGGTSTASVNVSGGRGANGGLGTTTIGGNGGASGSGPTGIGGTGGIGGASAAIGTAGTTPGGGGGAGGYTKAGGNGASGKVVITW